MDIVLAGTDSLWLLRKARSEKDLELVATDEAPLAPTVRASNLPAIVGALPQDFRVIGPQAPLELASFSREARPCIGSVRARTILGNLPPGAFLRVNGLSGKDLRIFVEGTALTLTHMAARLAQPIKEKALTEQAAFFRLMSLASELCGTYGRDPTNPARGDCAWGVDPPLYGTRAQTISCRSFRRTRGASGEKGGRTRDARLGLPRREPACHGYEPPSKPGRRPLPRLPAQQGAQLAARHQRAHQAPDHDARLLLAAALRSA